MAAEGDGAEVGMLEQIGDVGVDDAVEDEGGIEGGEILELAFDDGHDADLEQGAEVADMAHGDGVDDGLLVGKEAVERADGEIGLGGDAGGGDVVQRRGEEQRAGRIDNAHHRLEAARLHRQTTRRRQRLGRQLRRELGFVG